MNVQFLRTLSSQCARNWFAKVSSFTRFYLFCRIERRKKICFWNPEMKFSKFARGVRIFCIFFVSVRLSLVVLPRAILSKGAKYYPREFVLHFLGLSIYGLDGPSLLENVSWRSQSKRECISISRMPIRASTFPLPLFYVTTSSFQLLCAQFKFLL